MSETPCTEACRHLGFTIRHSPWNGGRSITCPPHPHQNEAGYMVGYWAHECPAVAITAEHGAGR